jgi:hypothetical protein
MKKLRRKNTKMINPEKPYVVVNGLFVCHNLIMPIDDEELDEVDEPDYD